VESDPTESTELPARNQSFVAHPATETKSKTPTESKYSPYLTTRLASENGFDEKVDNGETTAQQ
jgi:hypothetical protein